MLSLILIAAIAAGSPPNIDVASSFFAAGGGAGSFSTVRAFEDMIGADKFLEEENKLSSQYGQSDASSYVNMLDFAMADAWRLAGEADLSMPPPSWKGIPLAQELVRSGLAGDGSFRTVQFFDDLFGPMVAPQLLSAVDRKFGVGSAAKFTRMNNQFFYDVGQQVGTNVLLAPNH